MRVLIRKVHGVGVALLAPVSRVAFESSPSSLLAIAGAFALVVLPVLALLGLTVLADLFAPGIGAALAITIPGLPRPMFVKINPKTTPVGATLEGFVAAFEIPRALLYRGLTLDLTYTDTLSVAATTVKTFGVPIEKIEVVADNGNTLHSVRPTDLVREQMTEAGTPLAHMLVPPTVVTATANTGSAEIPIKFTLDNVPDGEDFMLPGWQFEQVQVLVYFTNTHANIYTGGTGVVTVQRCTLAYEAVSDVPQAQLAAVASRTELLLRSYKERVQAAAADTEFTIELPTSADIERIYIVTEDANRDPVATILNDVSLVQDGTVRRLDRVNAATLRTIGAERLQTTLPTGWHVIDFTKLAKTIKAALPATQFNSLDLVLNVAAVAGYVRAYIVRKAPK